MYIRKVLTRLIHPFQPKYVYSNHLAVSSSKGPFNVLEDYSPIGFTR
jgi:hypothetical protein